MVSPCRLDFSSMIISMLCYLIACLMLMGHLNLVYAHPIWMSSFLSKSMEKDMPQIDIVQLPKRSLASGRWGLRPGKRSISFGPTTPTSYDFDPGDSEIADTKSHIAIAYF